MREWLARLRDKPAFASFLSFGFIQGAQVLLPVLAFPYLSRVLGPDEFGILMFMLTLAVAAGMCVEWGFTLGAVRDVAVSRSDSASVRRTVSEVLSAKLILAVCSCVLAAAVFSWIPHALANPTGYGLAVAYGIVIGCNPTWYFQGKSAGMRRMALWDISSGAVALALTFLWLKKPEQWPLYLLFLAVCKGVAYTWQTIHMVRSSGGARFGFSLGWKALRRCFVLFSSRLSSMLYTQGNSLILAYLLPAKHLGMLLAADKIARAVVSVVGPVTQALFPEICAIRVCDPAKAARMLRLSLVGTALCMLLAAAMLWLTAPWLIPLALGPGYEETIGVLRRMVFFIPLLACNTVLGTQTLVSYGREQALTVVLLAVGVCSLPVVAILASVFGLYGAACMPVLVEGSIFLGLFWAVHRYCPEAFHPSRFAGRRRP